MSRAAFEVDPLTPTIGAEVRGLDLSGPLDDGTLAALKRAWSEHLVLFFRDQRLSLERLQTLGSAFGPLHVHPLGDVTGYPGIVEVRTDDRAVPMVAATAVGRAFLAQHGRDTAASPDAHA